MSVCMWLPAIHTMALVRSASTFVSKFLDRSRAPTPDPLAAGATLTLHPKLVDPGSRKTAQDDGHMLMPWGAGTVGS